MKKVLSIVVIILVVFFTGRFIEEKFGDQFAADFMDCFGVKRPTTDAERTLVGPIVIEKLYDAWGGVVSVTAKTHMLTTRDVKRFSPKEFEQRVTQAKERLKSSVDFYQRSILSAYDAGFTREAERMPFNGLNQ